MWQDKKRITYDEYAKLIEDVTSELFLSIMTLLQTKLPCSTNYFRYKENYENFMLGYKKTEEKTDGTVRTIASPKMMSKLSPV